MSILDKLIGLGLGDDLTETSWWTDTVFRELSRTDLDTAAAGPDSAGDATALTTESL